MERDPIEIICETFRQRGAERYGKEAVSQLEHGLQAALLARDEDASAELITAALLHDVGHIMADAALPAGCDENLDDHHELRAHGWLRKHFGDVVAEPVRLHVAAKRYLCSVDPDYVNQLSETSRKSFHDQGGVMTPAELAAFRAEPFCDDSLRLRRWDDTAKVPGMPTPSLEEFLVYLGRTQIFTA